MKTLKWKWSRCHHVAPVLRASAIVKEVCIYGCFFPKYIIFLLQRILGMMPTRGKAGILCLWPFLFVDLIWGRLSQQHRLFCSPCDLLVLCCFPCITLLSTTIRYIIMMCFICITVFFFLSYSLHSTNLFQALASRRTEVTTTFALVSNFIYFKTRVLPIHVLVLHVLQLIHRVNQQTVDRYYI